MNIQKIKNNFIKVELYINKDYGKSRTDKTHFRPNVNVFNDVQGASNNIGMYDNDFETGKMRSIISNPSLDRAEVDEYIKNEYANAKNEVDKTKMEILEKMESKDPEKQTNDTTETTEQCVSFTFAKQERQK